MALSLTSRLIFAFFLMATGCQALATPSPSPTEPPTATSTASATPAPTATPTTTATATATPTITPTSTLTATPTTTPTPSITPQAAVGFRFDNWSQVTLPENIRNGFTTPYLVFSNSNDRQTIGNLSTAAPDTNIQIVYMVSPSNPANRITLLETSASTGDQIYIHQGGKALAFFNQEPGTAGLYILNIENGLVGRIAPITSIAQRGIFSPPVWSPDGENLAVTLDTGYDLDIFLYQRDGGGRTNLTNSGSYDFFPTWSPDGTRMAFVSDRALCPSWIPGQPGFCDALTTAPPIGGHVYILDLATGTVEQASDEIVTEPPRWINNDYLVYATGDQADLLFPTRQIWLLNTRTNMARQILVADDEPNNELYLSDIWAPDATSVILQRATSSGTEILAIDTDGTIRRDRSGQLTFPRFGLVGSWSPRGDRIVIGGISGQCPYGIRVMDNTTYDFVATGNPPPTMCNPAFSPDGEHIAFEGITRSVDGRVDVYLANFNGFGARNITVDLRGSTRLIGWMRGNL